MQNEMLCLFLKMSNFILSFFKNDTTKCWQERNETCTSHTLSGENQTGIIFLKNVTIYAINIKNIQTHTFYLQEISLRK